MAATTEGARSEIDKIHDELDAEEQAADRQSRATEHPDATREEPPAPPIDELRVDGTVQLGLFNAGGKKPTSATITLSGGACELLDGKAYQKGDVIEFSGTAVVREVGQVDKADGKTGIVVSAKQKHVARITDLTVRGAA
jgi:hypothetical protein